MKRIYLSLITAIALMGSAYADRLVIKGSDTLGAKLVPQLAEQFKAQTSRHYLRHRGGRFHHWNRGDHRRHGADWNVQPPRQIIRSRRSAGQGR